MNAISHLVCFVAGIVFGAEVLQRVARALRARRQRRQHQALCRHLFATREKGEVMKVGHLHRLSDGRVVPWGFEIDCHGRVPAFCYLFDGERNVALWGGWSEAELREMATRPSEFAT